MSVIVNDTGFHEEDWNAPMVVLTDLAYHKGAIDLAHTDDPTVLKSQIDQLQLIRVAFPTFSDGRAFTIARRLRMMGYKGRLRANGPVIADQYTMARRVGFDEVEIPVELALRQPVEQWTFRTDWRANDYQAKLRA
ncbi:MAG: DUF934 domain-containing protein [Rhodobacteraceae bacterium]|nr:DUF934 domain-containing protein [Paracoccaceae bacterium]